jgi:hypothetical protein
MNQMYLPKAGITCPIGGCQTDIRPWAFPASIHGEYRQIGSPWNSASPPGKASGIRNLLLYNALRGTAGAGGIWGTGFAIARPRVSLCALGKIGCDDLFGSHSTRRISQAVPITNQ